MEGAKLKLNYKLWLEKDDKVFGDGPCELLQKVDRLGSLRQGAAEMKMAYSQAWELIKELEERLGFRLLEKQVGGPLGGGSILTVKARELMTAFISIREEAGVCLHQIEQKWFNKYFQTELRQNDKNRL